MRGNQIIQIVRSIILTVLIGAVCIVLPCTMALAAPDEDNTNIDLYARAAVLMDARSGRVLFEKNGAERLPMASTTKIMTCILALEYGKLEDYVEVSEYASKMPKVRLSMRPGEYYRMEDLLYSLMLESHNDSAVAIAEHVAGSMEEFAVMMNRKARDIGCKDTYFITPNGLDATTADGTQVHSTTARDLAAIMSYCINDSPRKELFLKITGSPSHEFTNYRPGETANEFESGDRNHAVNNHNTFLTMMEGALSGKTGFTSKAGYCYVGSLERDGRMYVVALLASGWPNHKNYKWSDTRKLMDYGLENYFYRDVLTAPPLDKIEVEAGIPANNHPYGTAYAEIRMDTGEEHELQWLLKEDEQVKMQVKLVDRLEAPVTPGQQVGSVSYFLNGQIIREYPITTINPVGKLSFTWITAYLLRLFCI